MMELFFQEIIIGYIEPTSKEQFWNYGIFIPNEEFKDYMDFFKATTCESGFDETKFDHALLEDKNWYVRNNGIRIGICIPAIYDDSGYCDIFFRYR